jgi:anti-sigma factor RsiW
MVISCEHVWREISNYLEGEVDPALRAAMEAHFKECKHCTAVLDGTRNVIELYGDGRLFELPAGFSRRLERRLAERIVPARRTTRSFWIMAVAAAALLAGGLTLGRSGALSSPELRSEHAQPGKDIPADMVVAVSEEGKTFHVPGCKYLHEHEHEKVRLIAASEAVREGYVPCVRCLRQYLRR